MCGCVVVWLYGCVVVALWSWRTTIFRAGAHRAVATGTASRQPKYSAREPIAPEPQALPRDSQNILCGSPSRRSHGHCLMTANIFCAGAHRAVAMGTASWQPTYSVREPITPQPWALPHGSQHILCGAHRAVAMGTALCMRKCFLQTPSRQNHRHYHHNRQYIYIYIYKYMDIYGRVSA